MLGPTAGRAANRAARCRARRWTTVHRNELRLLKLVNNLLDFARIEANRVEASYQPTDLAAMTARSGQRLPLGDRSARASRCGSTARRCGEPVFVDRDMWEKIVLNLLSNAFKFTFEGSVAVTLGVRGEHVELVVADTGTGIPAQRAAAPVRALPSRARARARGRTKARASDWRWSHELARMHERHGLRRARAWAAGRRSRSRSRAAAPTCPPSGSAPSGRWRRRQRADRPYVAEASRWCPTSRAPSADTDRGTARERDPARGRQRGHARLRAADPRAALAGRGRRRRRRRAGRRASASRRT